MKGTISDNGLRVLTIKINEMNRRARRLGLPDLKIDVVGEKIKTWTDEVGIERKTRLNIIEITGELPRINGWSVVAKVEFTEAGNFVTSAPGVEVDPAWRTVDNRCDHCHTSRRRNDLIVIRSDDEEKVVGRNCLADFVRDTNAEALLYYADNLNKDWITESEEASGAFESFDSLESILQVTSICIRKLGWVSGKVGYEWNRMSTKDYVNYLLYPPKNKEPWRKWREENDLYVTDHDKEEARKALEWLASIKPDNDYLHNLIVLRDLEYVPASKLGFAVSIIPAAQRAREQEVKRREFERQNKNKIHIGQPKERLRDLEVTVKRVRSRETDWGVTTIIVFEHGNAELTWFASGDRTDFEVGKTYTIDATVKKHEDNQWGKSTIVNRVKAA